MTFQKYGCFVACYALFLVSFVAANQRWMLTDKNVLVTGGSKGIGLAVVREFCNLGANVFTCARNRQDLETALESLRAEGIDNVSGVVADISTVEGREYLIKSCGAIFSKLDCLINNVGSNIRKPMIEYSSSEYDYIMRTNLESAFYLSQGFHSLLRRAGKASVVNIGIVAGGCSTSIRSGCIYAMTKAAMCQMTANLACEWAQDNIRGK
jgi:Tropinone reductase 1